MIKTYVFPNGEIRRYHGGVCMQFMTGSTGPGIERPRSEVALALLELRKYKRSRGSVGIHDWCVGFRTEDGFAVFVDDRPVGYRKSLEEAKTHAMNMIARLQADGDYRLNDRPQGFCPPPIAPICH